MAPAVSRAEGGGARYFHSGNGVLYLQGAKNGAGFRGTYRNEDGTYNADALKLIHRAFSAKYGEPISMISPRLIEFLDFLEDSLKPGATVTIVSGYRSPEYNTGLRGSGKLAAKASLHQYGMAADIKISGVKSERVWQFVRNLNFGGTGYYHGANVHVDVGPARFWDEKTSGVGTDISDENKLIEIVTDKDIYRTGEPIEMRFIRMTAFPIGVNPSFVLERRISKDSWRTSEKFTPTFATDAKDDCPQFGDIGQMLGIRWTLPKKIRNGRYRIRASFCGSVPECMPRSIATPEFEVMK